MLFPVQVIVSKELGEEEHVWLKSLSKKLDTGRMSKLVHKSVGLKQKSDREFADSVLQGTINSEENSGDFNLTRLSFDEDDILLLTGTYFLVML